MSWLDGLEDLRKRDWSSASAAERETASRDVIEISAFASGTAALVPVPFVDLALLLPVHTVMVMTIGRIHGRALSKAEAARVVAELGAIAGITVAGRAAISALKGLLPGLGGVIAAPAAFAMTWGMGRATVAYFENPKLSREHLKKVFDEAVAEGRKAFSKEAFDRFRRRHQDDPGAEAFRRAESTETPDAADGTVCGAQSKGLAPDGVSAAAPDGVSVTTSDEVTESPGGPARSDGPRSSAGVVSSAGAVGRDQARGSPARSKADTMRPKKRTL